MKMMEGVMMEVGEDVGEVKKKWDERVSGLCRIEKKIGGRGGDMVGVLRGMFDEEEKWGEKEEMGGGEREKERGGDGEGGCVIGKEDEEKEDWWGMGGGVGGMVGVNGVKGLLVKGLKMMGGVVGSLVGMLWKVGEGMRKVVGGFGKVFKLVKVGGVGVVCMMWELGKGLIDGKEMVGKGGVRIVEGVGGGI